MKILIAGLGLIGGSFALALRDREIADEILGVEKSDENAAEALRLGLADRIVTLEEGVPAGRPRGAGDARRYDSADGRKSA